MGCWFDPEPDSKVAVCTVNYIVWGAKTATFLAQQFGVSPNMKFNFYLVRNSPSPLPLLIITPG